MICLKTNSHSSKTIHQKGAKVYIFSLSALYKKVDIPCKILASPLGKIGHDGGENVSPSTFF